MKINMISQQVDEALEQVPGAVVPDEGGRREELEVAINKVLNGEIRRDRELKPGEPETLGPAHIQMILMKAGGMKQRAIAELLDYHETRVSVVLDHPDARYLLRIILGYAADAATDVPTALKLGSLEMLGIASEIARNTATKDETRLKAAFGWLDRAGHGKTETTKHEHSVNVSDDAAKTIAAAIKEAQGIEEADYYVVSGTERVSSEKGQAFGLLQNSGPAVPSGPPHGSPLPAPQSSEDEESAA